MIFKNVKKIHFIGIGGIGVSGIARYLLEDGYQVSGSDLVLNKYTEKLEKLGAKIYQSHKSDNIKNVDLVIYSSAVKNDNPEFLYAIEHKIKMMKRGAALYEISKNKKTFAVAGTHGKTTTSSMLASILNESETSDFIIGGKVLSFDTQALNLKSDKLVIESDESDGSFLLLKPQYTIITNIDADHLDYYKSLENLTASFLNYLNDNNQIQKAVVNLDDSIIAQNIKNINIPFFTYSLENSNANFTVKNIEINKLTTDFDIFFNQKKLTRLTINLIGSHNISNALAAFALSFSSGLVPDSIKDGLKNFKGVSRRLELLDHKYNFDLYDDYAHHPTEIECVLKAFKLLNKKVNVIFEPHRYTRTKDCWDEFTTCFSNADKLFVLPIYSANEKEIIGITSENLVKDINDNYSNLSQLITYRQISEFLSTVERDAIVVCLGAGPISQKIRDISNGNLATI